MANKEVKHCFFHEQRVMSGGAALYPATHIIRITCPACHVHRVEYVCVDCHRTVVHYTVKNPSVTLGCRFCGTHSTATEQWKVLGEA